MALLGHYSVLNLSPVYSSIQPGCMTADWLCNCTQMMSEPGIIICVELQPGYLTVHRWLANHNKLMITILLQSGCVSSVTHQYYTWCTLKTLLQAHPHNVIHSSRCLVAWVYVLSWYYPLCVSSPTVFKCVLLSTTSCSCSCYDW